MTLLCEGAGVKVAISATSATLRLRHAHCVGRQSGCATTTTTTTPTRVLTLSIVAVLAVADGLFGLCWSKRTDELLTPTHPPFPVPNKPYGFYGR